MLCKCLCGGTWLPLPWNHILLAYIAGHCSVPSKWHNHEWSVHIKAFRPTPMHTSNEYSYVLKGRWGDKPKHNYVLGRALFSINLPCIERCRDTREWQTWVNTSWHEISSWRMPTKHQWHNTAPSCERGSTGGSRGRQGEKETNVV